MPTNMTSSTSPKTPTTHSSNSPQLSPRQVEILSLLQKGKANKEIAYELGIGLGTVKQHVVALFKKLKVTNRTMAVSKGYSLGTPAKQSRGDDATMTAEAALERRPVTVLSLIPHKTAKNLSKEYLRHLYRTLTDVAFDFDAIFFARREGGGDMIFGVERTRIHDVLRAVRAATAVANEMATHSESPPSLSGGLSSGVVLASMNRLGTWSGEAIAGAVIASTRQLSSKAKPGMLALGESALQLIRFLGAEHNRTPIKSVPLTNPFQWRLCGRNLDTPFRGRNDELNILKKYLTKLVDENTGGIILLEGESGIGKSALIWKFTDHCSANNISVLMKACPAPDSQPSTPIAGNLIEPGSHNSIPVSKFHEQIRSSSPNNPMVIVIDDTHLLPKDALDDLTTMLSKLSHAPILFLLASRGHTQVPDEIRSSAKIIHLKRLETHYIDEIIKDLNIHDLNEASKISDLAAGIPIFSVEMAHHLRDQKANHEIPLPLSLLSLVIARIDAFQLDRHLLRLIAMKDGKNSRDSLLEKWLGSEEELDAALEKSIVAGLLFRDSSVNANKKTFCFRHPLVQTVVSFALKDYGQPTH